MVPPFRRRGPSGTCHATQAWRVAAIQAIRAGAIVVLTAGRVIRRVGLLRPEGNTNRTRLLRRNLELLVLLLALKLFQAVVLRR